MESSRGTQNAPKTEQIRRNIYAQITNGFFNGYGVSGNDAVVCRLHGNGQSRRE